VIRPGLGVRIITNNEFHTRRLGIEGVIIDSVQRGSAAFKAGLRGLQTNRWGDATLGDVIIGINDKKVSSFGELGDVLERYKIGDVVTIKFLRDGEEKSVRLQLQEVQ
jgi:S1-C subfamily serine protease